MLRAAGRAGGRPGGRPPARCGEDRRRVICCRESVPRITGGSHGCRRQRLPPLPARRVARPAARGGPGRLARPRGRHPEAFADSDDAQELLDAADVLVAAASNEIVDVQRITGLQVDEGGHVRFETVDEPVLVGMLGRQLRVGAAWEPGESWPVKIVETAADVTEYLDLAEGEARTGAGSEAPAGRDEAAGLAVGDFRVVLTDDGDLVVSAPPGRSVTVSIATSDA
ncbi:hypothetical protein NKG05_17060 [Oerskovia sp. M15]